MKFFDAHCDTIQPIVETDADFLHDPKLHVTLPALRAAGVCCQVFASWAWGKKYGERVFPVAMELVNATRALCQAHPLELTPGLTGAVIRDGCRDGDRTVVIAGLEGADALEGHAERISLFYDAGVRILTLSWGDTPFCGSTYGHGGGLTAPGRELVERCEELGVVVDVGYACPTQGFRRYPSSS